jgi:hypothetical protein
MTTARETVGRSDPTVSQNTGDDAWASGGDSVASGAHRPPSRTDLDGRCPPFDPPAEGPG